MEQAFNHFNSGKYKEAYNQLNSTPLNIESYQPNLIVCEYLSNRSIQSSQQCLKKLSQLLAKKNKKQNDNYERLTQQLIKYNLGILMILNGKKENAFTLFNDIASNEKCFIDYLKYRMLLLLMELNVCLKSSVKAINLAGKYINNPYESRNNQWISSIFHEHSKAYYCMNEEIGFMVSILLSQAMIQLGVSEGFLVPNEERQKLKEVLLEKVRKRKNNINKYYEINLLMIDRFYEAQKQFHQNNIEKAVKLLHFPSIQSQYDQMPQTKIITNIYSSFSNNNIAIINYSKGKKAIALYFLNKAQTLLSKGCTGVQDKDLQLFSSNYANHSFRIAFNLGLLALSLKSSNSYAIFEALKKINQQKIDFKYWYRVGQSQLEYYHLNYPRLHFQQKTSILESSLKSFENSLICLSKREIPDLSLSQTFAKNEILKEDQIETIIIKMNGQTQYYKQNIILLICYISLILKRYYKVIALAKQIIKNQKSTDLSKLYSYHYLFQSYLKLDRLKEATRYGREAEKLTKSLKKEKLSTYYESKSKLINEEMEVENLMVHQNALMKTKSGLTSEGFSILEKDRTRNKMKNSEIINISHKYLQARQKLEDHKYT